MVETRHSNTRQLRSSGQAPGRTLSQMRPAKKRNKPPPKKTKEPRGRKAEESGRQDEEVEDNPNDKDDPRDLDTPTVDAAPGEARLGAMDSISGSQVPPPPTTRSRKRQTFTLPPIPSVVISVRRAPNEASARSTTVSSPSRKSTPNTLRAASRVGPASRTLTSASHDQARCTTADAASRTLSSAPTSVANGSPEPNIEHAQKLPAICEEEEEDEEEEEQKEQEDKDEDKNDDDDDDEEVVVVVEEKVEEMHQEEPVEVEDEVTQQNRDAKDEIQEELGGGDQHRHTRRYSEDERLLGDFSDNEREPEVHTEETHYQPELPAYDDDDDEDVPEEHPRLSRLTRGNETAKQTIRKESAGTRKRLPKSQVQPPLADRAKRSGKGSRKKPFTTRATGKPATTRKKQTPAIALNTYDNEVTTGEKSDEDDEEDDDENYKPGPLPDWAQERAEECYEAYYNEMLKIAHNAKKSPQSVFTHVNDIAPVTVRARNPWNAYLSWYNQEGPNEKPDEWTTQQWTTFISEEYDKEVEARLPDAEDRDDPHQVREAMMEFIVWSEDRLTAYLEEAKSDPRKASRLLHKTSTPFMQM
ncbi:hypothetical protein V5O48_017462, partial [Marasmius crinis-equi]